MRSYEAARGYFSFWETLFWCVVVGGGIVALISMGTVAGMRRTTFGLVLLAAMPGAYISLLGFFGVIGIQVARAAVDSAEYGQQTLKVARDQLEVSRRSLALQQGAPVSSFVDAVGRQSEAATSPFAAGASFADMPKTDANKEPEEKPRKIIDHNGQKIEFFGDRFVWSGIPFDTLENARQHLDRLSEFVPEAIIKGAPAQRASAEAELSSEQSADGPEPPVEEAEEPIEGEEVASDGALEAPQDASNEGTEESDEADQGLTPQSVKPEEGPAISAPEVTELLGSEPEDMVADEAAVQAVDPVGPEAVEVSPKAESADVTEAEEPEPLTPEIIEYQGQQIRVEGSRYCVGNRGFKTLEKAQNYIDVYK